MAAGSVVVVGGAQGLGRELAQVYADEGRDVVVTGRDPSRAETAADEIGGATRGIGFDLAEPHTIAAAAGRGRPRRPPRPRRDRARRQQGARVRHRRCAQARHAQAGRLHRGDPRPRAAPARPLQHPVLRRAGARSAVPGLDHCDHGQRWCDRGSCGPRLGARAGSASTPSTRRSSVTARSGATWPRSGTRRSWTRTPTGRLVTMAEVASAARFLLENEAMNGINLVVDGGWMCM